MNLNMFFRYIFIFAGFIIISGCSNNKTTISENSEMQTPESQYIKAMYEFDNKNFGDAIKIFEDIEKIYPLSNEAIQSQIMIAFIDYIALDYESAIIKYTKLIKRYPSLKNIDYVYYMRAICYYEQISHEGLDSEYNTLALENLQQVINRFPNSQYAKDSSQKIILVKSNIAAKHMTIARFYHKNKKYTAALNRYKIVVENFAETKFIPEALYRISEIYYSIGMIDESIKTAAILGHNYPKSEWYQYSYNNIKEKDKGSKFFNSINKFINK
tara:strand:- start:7147 stop:7959 length:813 start_codon:yes stop_codon:yes gene_type:complete